MRSLTAPLRALVLCVLASLATACVAGPRVTAMHDPLYRAQAHTSTITATAFGQRGALVDQVTISVTVGDLTACTELNQLFPSLIPCRQNASVQTWGCGQSPAAASLTCAAPISVGDRQLVTYTATARTSNGRTATTTPITYAGGAPLTQVRVRLPIFGDRLFAWETARPIWWHTDATGGGADVGRIDVGFFPDADYGTNYAQFANDATAIIREAHFSTATNFSQNYTVLRGNFNLWAGPAGADGQGCTRNFNGAAGNVAGATDGEVIVHSVDFRDCAAISFTGAGTVSAAQGDRAWLYVHESSHFLHGLGDEYCCDGGYSSISTPRNVFPSQNDCQNAATANGFATGLCVEIRNATRQTGRWRIDNGDSETMEDRENASDFRDTAARAVGSRYSQCAGGGC